MRRGTVRVRLGDPGSDEGRGPQHYPGSRLIAGGTEDAPVGGVPCGPPKGRSERWDKGHKTSRDPGLPDPKSTTCGDGHYGNSVAAWTTDVPHMKDSVRVRCPRRESGDVREPSPSSSESAVPQGNGNS